MKGNAILRLKINRCALLSIVCLFILTCAMTSCDGGTPPEETTADETEVTTADETEVTTAAETQPETTETAPGETTSEETTAEEVFVPVIRFAVCSDIHITTEDCEQGKRLEKLFDSAYRYADGQEYTGLDAVIMVGDMTDYGYRSQYNTLNRIIADKKRDGTQIVTVMGNHEQFGGNIADYELNMGETANKHIVINGFHFIGISTREYPDFHNYSDETVEWLASELASADDGSGKPIFTFQHLHLSGTVYGSGLMYTPKSSEIKKAYSAYPQVVNFSGDSHAPINHPNSIFQKDYTALNTGTLFYFEMERGMTGGTLPEGKDNAAQYLIVEVDAKNTVKIRPYDILADDFFKTPSNTDDPDKEIVYTVKDPSDKSGFIYTKDAGRSASSPRFAENAKITVGKISARSVTLTVPQALDDCCIYSYTATLTPADGGKAIKFSCFSEYYFEPMPESVTFTVGNLKPETEYEVSVVPENALGKKGDPITAKIKTSAAPEADYKSENPVTYSGTFTDFESLENLNVSENGDVFAGDIDVKTADPRVSVALCGNGYRGSTGLEISRNMTGNSAILINATPENKNTVDFNGTEYLRVYIDMTGLDFRKASFGLITSDGTLYTSDNNDGGYPEIYLLADGQTEWKTVKTGPDGCFGAQESESLLNYKGWIAVKLSEMRAAGGKTADELTVRSVYLYWDYLSMDMAKTGFVIDEIHLVSDYTVFAEYVNR